MRLKKYIHSCDKDFPEYLLKIGQDFINLFKIPKNRKSNDICTTYGSTITDHAKLSNRTVSFRHNDDVYWLKDEILKK